MPDAYPSNPILVTVERGGAVESVHRGSWAVVEADGTVVESVGDLTARYFARSAVKSLQALPLIETGAAERFGFDDAAIALALASHSGEACHTEHVAATLARVGLGEEALRCGSHAPFDSQTRRALSEAGEAPTSLHNNCSGKHTGFLAVAKHLGAELESYLDPDAPGQALSRHAIASMSDADESRLVPGIDGCSAPTYRLSLKELGTAFARVTTPDGLTDARRDACRRMVRAVQARPELIAGNRKRLCTDLVRASGGRLFPKIGAESMYALGNVDSGQALAVKVDDGQKRALAPLVLELCRRFGWLSTDELESLGSWKGGAQFNHAKLEVGHVRVHAQGV